MDQKLFPNLGPGVGLRRNHTALFIENPPSSVRWVEVISENFMRWQNGILPSQPISNLEKVRRNLPVALHGVSLSIGSADPLDSNYLKHLKELIERIDPVYVSDHLCWTAVDGKNLHDLLPLAYTEESIRWVVQKVTRIQEDLGRRILLENVSSYAEFSTSEMPEWQFVSEIAERADCGILLDINNVYVSGKNHGFDPRIYLRSIPLERVGQIHLAGHSMMDDGLLNDTHDAPVCDAVWELYEEFIATNGMISSMVERDDNIPEWTELEAEIQRIALAERKAKGDVGETSAATL